MIRFFEPFEQALNPGEWSPAWNTGEPVDVIVLTGEDWQIAEEVHAEECGMAFFTMVLDEGTIGVACLACGLLMTSPDIQWIEKGLSN